MLDPVPAPQQEQNRAPLGASAAPAGNIIDATNRFGALPNQQGTLNQPRPAEQLSVRTTRPATRLERIAGKADKQGQIQGFLKGDGF